MKKHILVIVLALFGLTVVSATSCKGTGSNSVELTIFHTNDIHSHLRSAKIDPFGLGGLARLSTLLTQLRKSAPVSVTLDGGDYSEGAWYFSVDTGANMLKAMGMMGYDAACLGNHDFLIGPDQIIRTMKDAGTPFPVMAANLEMSDYPRAAELKQVLPATTIKNVGGLKIGIIGLTTFELLYDSYMAPVHITNHLEAATKYALALRPQVDVLILVSHNNFEVNALLGRAVPGIDAVISGHSHKKVPTAVMVQNAGRSVPIVETGEWGKFLGELKLTVDTSTKAVQFKGYQLHPVTSDLPEDPKLVAFINQQDAALDAQFHDDVNRVVADTEFDLIQNDNVESGLGNLAVKAYRASTHADLAMEEISLTGVSMAHGPATLMDLHDVVPHIYDYPTGKEWKLRVWNAKGSDLALMINVLYTVDGLMPLGSPVGWLSAENAVIVWDPGIKKIPLKDAIAQTRAIPAVKSITIGGQPLDNGARYKVALADGLITAMTQANEKLHLNLDISDMQDSGIEAWQSVVDYATAAKKLTLQDLRVGGRTFTQTPDLAIFYYGMDTDGSKITVEVQNLGLQGAPAGNLFCSTGLPNDFVSYSTEAQKWTRIGTVAVPPLAPGASTSVSIPWNTSTLARGYWPVECTAQVVGDKYTPNNTAQKVFRLTSTPPSRFTRRP
jgi:2',3'-cyclic-nucleotide 2'-phosphodiesterase (5'-nucleotidase family)